MEESKNQGFVAGRKLEIEARIKLSERNQQYKKSTSATRPSPRERNDEEKGSPTTGCTYARCMHLEPQPRYGSSVNRTTGTPAAMISQAHKESAGSRPSFEFIIQRRSVSAVKRALALEAPQQRPLSSSPLADPSELPNAFASENVRQRIERIMRGVDLADHVQLSAGRFLSLSQASAKLSAFRAQIQVGKVLRDVELMERIFAALQAGLASALSDASQILPRLFNYLESCQDGPAECFEALEQSAQGALRETLHRLSECREEFQLQVADCMRRIDNYIRSEGLAMYSKAMSAEWTTHVQADQSNLQAKITLTLAKLHLSVATLKKAAIGRSQAAFATAKSDVLKQLSASITSCESNLGGSQSKEGSASLGRRVRASSLLAPRRLAIVQQSVEEMRTLRASVESLHWAACEDEQIIAAREAEILSRKAEKETALRVHDDMSDINENPAFENFTRFRGGVVDTIIGLGVRRLEETILIEHLQEFLEAGRIAAMLSTSEAAERLRALTSIKHVKVNFIILAAVTILILQILLEGAPAASPPALSSADDRDLSTDVTDEARIVGLAIAKVQALWAPSLTAAKERNPSAQADNVNEGLPANHKCD